jgi:WD40 repeat protein
MDELKEGLTTFDKPKYQAQSPNLGALDMKINGAGTRLAVSSIDFAVSIFNIHSESGLTHYKSIDGSSMSGKLDFNPNDGEEILTGALSLKTIDIKSGMVTKEFGKDQKAIQSVSYSPNGLLCATGTIDGAINIFDCKTFELKKSFIECHTKNVRAVKFSQNSQLLVSSGEDAQISLTDVETLTQKLSVSGHSDWVTSLSVNSHVKSIVSGSLDRSIRVWDLNSGKCTKTISMKEPVWGVAFSPSGEYMVAACQDGTVQLIALQL